MSTDLRAPIGSTLAVYVRPLRRRPLDAMFCVTSLDTLAVERDTETSSFLGGAGENESFVPADKGPIPLSLDDLFDSH